MNKTIIVTGATSMIGTAIIREYLRNDVKRIYAVVRPDSQNISRLPHDERITIVESEVSGYGKLTDLINDKCDVFFHIAWDGTGATREKSTVGQANNIIYTLNALAAAKTLGCVKFVGAGSQAEYGRLDVPEISEESPTKPVIPYGIAKFAAGQLALAEARKIDISCFWVRIFSVFGLYDKNTSMISNAVQKMKAGERMSFTPALQRWEYLHCDDAARAFYLIGEKSVGQKVYCLGSGQPRQLKEFIYAIRDIVNPYAELGIGDIPYKGTEVMNLCADITLLNHDTGWKPEIDFDEGIKRLVLG
ncbi:NAD-dependent epimerase/dehydratase family protein [Ruminococcus flavefaciens]|uniref:NAD-dependent epimerase/dehydratase family protein n=1 Tax=Ruminococcus flavefaciens TaxID=1265 RepID=UPI0004640039|nr:NAD(P)-dependent oxidoreductase [Ruminococcus flavefaciens]